ncbi:sulfite exporter TauE/SafE family protein [Pseudorhodoplanes sp.]|uniref:sulfite exporter TauE/SafE family protein n=1 Tax=Pseudorhodoplanes sp. TaxID=1934341 RepID=UPI003D1250AC
MGSTELTIAVLGLFLAGALKGATGIGYSTCALPFLVASVGLQRAMALVIVPAIVSNFSLMMNGGGTGAALRRFWRFYIAIIPGIALGTGLLAGADHGVAVQLLGILTLTYATIAIARPGLAIGPIGERILALPAGFANGVLTGFTGSQIMPLMPYMMALRLSASEQVQAINLAVTLTSLALGGALLIAGIVDWNILVLSALGALPAIIGVEAGSCVRRRLSTQRFRQFSLVMLGLLGLGLMVQSNHRLADCSVTPRSGIGQSAPECPKTASQHASR